MGWAQLALGVILISRPRRWALAAGIVGNLAIIGVWAVSRTVGLPEVLGGDGTAEGVGSADLLATVLEGMIVAGFGHAAGRARRSPAGPSATSASPARSRPARSRSP